MEQGSRVESMFSPGTDLGTLEDSEITCLTPRRRLCLDRQENSPPENDAESGFCSSLDTTSPTVPEGSQSSLDSVFSTTSGIGSSRYSTMDSGGSLRRCKKARKASRLRCCSTSSENKENPGKPIKDGVFKIPFLPFQERPVSLPTFPSSPMEENYKQINSPFGNLALSSPPTDGFDAEVLSETAEDSQHSSPQSLDALLVSATTQFVSAVNNSSSVLKPTPVRPKPLLGKPLQRHLSLLSTNNQDNVVRAPKRYILSPRHESAAKKNPPAVTDSQPSCSTSVSPKQSLVRFYSCEVHPTQCQASDEDELIGDHTKPYCLPIEKSASPFDLKCISPQTVADVLSGKYNEVINSYTIIDCRYPYEYKGGHIQGAINIWDKDELLQKYLSNPSHPHEEQEGRDIFIFHCEFSSKRGPEMSRLLRKMDRQKNDMAFPKLYYPEMYLAHGGYKCFYEQFPNLCVPEHYCSMSDKKHQEEYRIFSKRSKSWSGENKKRCHTLGRRRHTLLDDPRCTASRQL